MSISNKREALILFLGDVAIFVSALWLTLFLRYGGIPKPGVFQDHLIPFSIIFFLWVLVFFIAGLYEKHTTILKSRLPNLLSRVQAVNSVVAVLFFYLVPYFGITPKTNLFIYLVISFLSVLGWRLYVSASPGFRRREKAILIGSGEEMEELKNEVNQNPKYSIYFVSAVNLEDPKVIDLEKEVLAPVFSEGVSAVVIDLKNDRVGPVLPKLYKLIFSRVRFIDMYKVYEDIFDRIPLSLLNYKWFLENISRSAHAGYDFLKRFMDVAISLTLGIISLILYPLIALAIKLEDSGPVFIVQERVGKGNNIIKLAKFRSMRKNDSGVWPVKGDGWTTKVGRFLRDTRLDELPQLWSVLKGDISLIGPRPDIIDLGRKLAEEIPYYTVRNLIEPGLSGWAQIRQDTPPHSVEETKLRLSYDFYYIKNRSFMLDLRIALQTIKTLLSRSGR